MNRAKTDYIGKLRAYFEHLPFDVKGKALCVCLSGGADSVSLLCGLLEISEQFGFTVKACHFNHMIRGEEADRDEDFCKSLCIARNVEIYCGRDDVPAFAKMNKMSLEEAARDRRYAFFSRIYSKKSIDFCLTAHNMNDDAETLLLNLIRGSGSYGASSIAKYTEKLLRPMLGISREEIEEYLKEISQDYIIDSTNDSVEYTRNYIRKIILPQMQVLNPSVVTALSRYIESVRNDREYFEDEVNQAVDSDLRDMPKAIRDRVFIKKAKDAFGISLNKSLIEKLDNAAFSNRRCIVSLFDEYEAIIDNGKVAFVNRIEIKDFEYELQPLHDGENSAFDGRISVNLFDKNDDFEIINKISTHDLLSFDNISGVISVRNRRVGDKICIHGINRSLKKLFIEKGIPKEYRNIIPIICDEEGILYVPFVGISDRAYPKSGENKRLLITVFNTVDKERWSNAYEK